ncbi:type I inositol polyphosphate 5-phosphatase 8-like isoform X1 [Hibiscus syriacus]|uniref:type I inositol polyphosphate 5-phosphatase 8-like isoform X1 n=1 Tax=Hibiscus syriacus TaxID=106335 RepID=UPI001923E8AA|nr:type I inositol polyphosphate 5-phosphatase 8-like isoform X1 [Hibiscus syriacus]XP_039066590.1 type I inositol polyphosphate 5-phosphatase 8-like isoform X1 [Hibiscus syriacus]
MGKVSKFSWPKVIVRKWLNIPSGADEFHSDYDINGKIDERRKSCSDEDYYTFVPEDFSEGWLMEAAGGIKPTLVSPETLPVTDSVNLRMFVGTWNVGGKSPRHGLNLRDWLRSPAPADIYVLGFQEIVPLNAGNVLGAEDNGPAAQWLYLIRQALNTNPSDLELAQCYNIVSLSSPRLEQQVTVKPSISCSDLLSLEDEIMKDDFERPMNLNSSLSEEGSPSLTCMSSNPKQRRFCLAASKQMVGLFLCVWVRADLYQHISNLKVSCVGRGIMGYLGNKGSISISMTLHQTTFCFVCTHLTSGEKEGDEIRRNSDVAEILKRTRFSHTLRGRKQPLPPHTILDHDKIIWLGDLNYRLAAGYADKFKLLKKNDWQALLEEDQLRLEQRAGRVFKGWEEGMIYFAPTYKYLADSDDYVVQTSNSKEKQRIPAWCDRILWKGEGIKQMWYSRGELRFSDHRPVYSLFSVQVNSANYPISTARSCPPTLSKLTACVAKVQAEELLLIPREQSCLNTTPRF